MFSDKGTEACWKAIFLALQEKDCVQITKLTGSLLSTLNGLSCSSDQNPKSLFEHIIFDNDTVEETHFVNKDERIQYIHGTTIGLFLSCFITQKKSITNQPSSSRNDQHLISPYKLHHLIRTKRLQEWNKSNDQMHGTHFKENPLSVRWNATI